MPITSTASTTGDDVQPEPAGAILLAHPPVAATVLANHFRTAFAATVPTAPAPLNLTDLIDWELIDRAKSAKFHPKRKWQRSRNLGSAEYTRAIAPRYGGA